MKIAKINLVFFSPTGSTKKTLERLGRTWTEDYEATAKEIDVTPRETEQECHSFSEKEMVFFGVPSFGGRVPEVAAKRFSNMKGNNTPAVLVVTYGNRAYEDTLLELRDLVRKNGFIPIAAVAAVTEHSIFREFASGRPDAEDRRQLHEFAAQIQKALEKIEDICSGVTLSLPGNRPYKEYKGVPLKPSSGKQCNGCKVCIRECPVGAIALDNPAKVDNDLCISCMRCVYVCPQHSRTAAGLMYNVAQKKLKKACTEAKENEIFLPEQSGGKNGNQN